MRTSSQEIDLVAMARWCQNYLANNPLPERGWQCRFSFWGLHMPIFAPWPYIATGERIPNLGLVDPIVEGDTDSRMDYAYIHMREMAGSYEAVQRAEEGVRQRILSYVGEDGLSRILGVVAGVKVDEDDPERWASSWATGKALYAQTELFRLTQDDSHRRLARKLFTGLRSLASWDAGRAYYEGGGNAWRNGQWYAIGGDLFPWVVEPVTSYWENTGDPEALEFASAFADGMLANLQPNLGEGAVQADGTYLSHAHCQLHAISGVAHLGALTREPRYIEWARRVYEYVRRKGTDCGWFPESFTLPPHQRHTEICLIADMIYTAIWLAEAGYPGCFDHAERYTRNILRNAQFFVTDAYESLYRQVHADKPADAVEEQLQVIRSIQGGFVSGPTPNDLVDADLEHHGTAGSPPMLLDFMGCCPPEGMRALRTVWRHVVTSKDEGVYINMALPCEHEEATVKTSLPGRGEQSVVAGQAGDYFIRPPEWAPRNDVTVSRNGNEISAVWKGDYILASQVAAGEQISIAYPLVSFVQSIDLTEAGYHSGSYTVKWTGNTATHILPEGKYMPLFQRPPMPCFKAQME